MNLENPVTVGTPIGVDESNGTNGFTQAEALMTDDVILTGMMSELQSTEVEMAPASGLAYASWVHGSDIHIERPDRLNWMYRQGFGTQLNGKAETTNWFHFAIPTPVIVEGVRYKLDSVLLRFTTQSVESIVRHIHVYDGNIKIASHDNVNLTGSHGLRRFGVPNDPQIFWGVGISIGVQFLRNNRNMWFIAAGADFLK